MLDDLDQLDILFEKLLETGSIMDDEIDVKTKLNHTFNFKYYKSDKEFIENLYKPSSFEFISWTHFLVNQDQSVCNAENFFLNIKEHDLTQKFREKFFNICPMDEFLRD